MYASLSRSMSGLLVGEHAQPSTARSIGRKQVAIGYTTGRYTPS